MLYKKQNRGKQLPDVFCYQNKHHQKGLKGIYYQQYYTREHCYIRLKRIDDYFFFQKYRNVAFLPNLLAYDSGDTVFLWALKNETIIWNEEVVLPMITLISFIINFNHGHNISRHFHVLPNLPFTSSEAKSDYQ